MSKPPIAAPTAAPTKVPEPFDELESVVALPVDEDEAPAWVALYEDEIAVSVEPLVGVTGGVMLTSLMLLMLLLLLLMLLLLEATLLGATPSEPEEGAAELSSVA